MNTKKIGYRVHIGHSLLNYTNHLFFLCKVQTCGDVLIQQVFCYYLVMFQFHTGQLGGGGHTVQMFTSLPLANFFSYQHSFVGSLIKPGTSIKR
jgi:hypothetical protein